MLDPISLTAITAVLVAVGEGMANEAGKRAWESAGGLVRRIAGREVRAPTGPDERDSVARLIHAGVHNDPAYARAWLTFARHLPASSRPSPKHEFPPSVRFFTDREEAIKKLDKEAFRAADGRPRAALLHAARGISGMGISTLAVHYGWREKTRRRFPDGQLYLDLHGPATGSALDTGAALLALLRQLGVAEDEVPPTREERVAAYRRLVAEQRLLIVLDHAHSAAQVRGLLTSAPDVLVLIVAPGPLAGLDAVPVAVGPLADRHSKRLLTHIVGKDVMAGARDVLPPLLDRCGGSPFALRAAAPRLAAPSAPVHPPEVTPVPEPDPVRAAVEDAVRRVSPEAARLFRLMALRAWPGFDHGVAAEAAGLGALEAGPLLDELVQAALLEQPDSDRYTYRPAVRSQAEEAAVREEGLAACSAAVSRTIGAYLRVALRAADAALPQSWRVPALPEGLAAGGYPSRGAALDALIRERGNLVQAVYAAEEFEDAGTAVLLARALWPLQLKAGYHEELLPALRLAARTADDRFPGSRTAGALHAQVAHSLTELRQFAEAETAARTAADNEQAAGHARGHASCVEFLGLLRLREWRYAEAYDCFEEAGLIYDTIGREGEGSRDLPRARALLRRHQGRALRGLGRFAEARDMLTRALDHFRGDDDMYNAARALTDLAETELDAGEAGAALGLIDEAERLLDADGAPYQLRALRSLRQRCVSPGAE